MTGSGDPWHRVKRTWLARYPHVADERTIFTIAPGWWQVAEAALCSLEAVSVSQMTVGQSAVVVLEMKEKYGSLRIDTSRVTPAITAIIDQAEAESLRTCSRCGRPGCLRDHYEWMVTLCDRCADECRSR